MSEPQDTTDQAARRRWELTVFNDGDRNGPEVMAGSSCPATQEQIDAAVDILAGMKSLETTEARRDHLARLASAVGLPGAGVDEIEDWIKKAREVIRVGQRVEGALLDKATQACTENERLLDALDRQAVECAEALERRERDRDAANAENVRLRAELAEAQALDTAARDLIEVATAPVKRAIAAVAPEVTEKLLRLDAALQPRARDTGTDEPVKLCFTPLPEAPTIGGLVNRCQKPFGHTGVHRPEVPDTGTDDRGRPLEWAVTGWDVEEDCEFIDAPSVSTRGEAEEKLARFYSGAGYRDARVVCRRVGEWHIGSGWRASRLSDAPSSPASPAPDEDRDTGTDAPTIAERARAMGIRPHEPEEAFGVSAAPASPVPPAPDEARDRLYRAAKAGWDAYYEAGGSEGPTNGRIAPRVLWEAVAKAVLAEVASTPEETTNDHE